jgi:hypothetical protein
MFGSVGACSQIGAGQCLTPGRAGRLDDVADWHRRFIVNPLVRALAEVPVGGEVSDRELLGELAVGVEGLFRSEVRFQYPGWPPESTTDGSSVYVCWRSGDHVLDVAGLTHFDFDGHVFPFRAELAVDGTQRAQAAVFIGQVDEESGLPPHLPAGSIVVAIRDEGGEVVSSVQLIAGRRQVPICWTRVLEWSEVSTT